MATQANYKRRPHGVEPREILASGTDKNVCQQQGMPASHVPGMIPYEGPAAGHALSIYTGHSQEVQSTTELLRHGKSPLSFTQQGELDQGGC